jgi:hypothetical protein
MPEMTIDKYVKIFLSWSSAQSSSRFARDQALLQSYDDNCMAALESLVPPACIAEIDSKGMSLSEFVGSISDEVIAQTFGSPYWACDAPLGSVDSNGSPLLCAFNRNAFGSSVCETCRTQHKGWTCTGCFAAQNPVGTMRCRACRLPNVKAMCGPSATPLESQQTYAASVVQAPASAPTGASESHAVVLREPLPFTVPEMCDEQIFNETMNVMDTGAVCDDTLSSKPFWRALTKVAPITSIEDLNSCEDKAHRTASQHIKDMNLSRSYRKLRSLTGGDGGFDLLFDSLSRDDCARFRLLLDIDIDQVFARAPVTAGEEGGCTIFHSAAKNSGSSEFLDVLKAKLDPQDFYDILNASSHLPWKNTALHHAARLGNVPVILKLNELGAVTSKTNGDGYTPLEVAAKYLQLEAFRVLLSLKKSQKFVVTQVLRDLLKGMDVKYHQAIANHNSDCERVGLEQRKADFETWRSGALQEFRTHHAALFNVIEISLKEPGFGRPLLLDFADDERESISRIKRGTFARPNLHYDVLSPSVFHKSDVVRLHSHLFQCIGFTLSNVASLIDVQEKLSEYESSCPDASKSALYFVAWARAAAMRGADNDAFLQQHLLARFVACCETIHVNASEWLSADEVAIAAQNPLDIFHANPAHSGDESGRDVSQDASWLEKLSDSQRAPVDRLSKLVGLESIKKDAKWMYHTAMSQKESQRLGIKSSTIERLNFAFLGNPGTGKTTVASIVAQILHQSGARGPVFDKMTGPEALAMGSKEFCARLAKLTGDTKSQAPPPTFRKGIQIEMCWSHEKQGPDIDTFRKFTPATESATVLSIENSNFTCDRSLPLCKGDSVKFIGTLPEFLSNHSSYTVQVVVGNEFSLTNVSNTKELSESFQVQWHKVLRGVSVKSNYVFHCATHHHLEPNIPIRFASNVGDGIPKDARVYVKRVIDAFSFTVSLSLTNRDKADVELQSPVEPAEVGTIYVDNVPESPVFVSQTVCPHTSDDLRSGFQAKSRMVGTRIIGLSKMLTVVNMMA